MKTISVTKWLSALAILPVAGYGHAMAITAEDEAKKDLVFDPGTKEDRDALFDFLMESTMERDAFASLQNHPYHQGHPKGIDVPAKMKKYRDELIAADTDEKMWYALHKISNARKDRHLRVRTVAGGLEVPESLGVRVDAPIAFAADFSDLDSRFFFVSDLPTNIAELVDGPEPALGDRLVAVNDRTIEAYVEAIRPYHRYSTENHFWWRLADAITRTRDFVPHSEFYCESLKWLDLALQRPDGTRYEIRLPYMDRREIRWAGHGERRYPGFSRIDEMSEYETYDLHLPDDRHRPVVLLQWDGFRGDLPDAMDDLVAYAQEHGLIDHHVIVDATRSGGGSNGAYALARLQSRPFRTTFGNLMVSDVMERWVEDRLERWRTNPPRPSRGQDATLVHEWLKEDVRPAIKQGKRYTNDVPFKGVLPKWADGIVDPAPDHFTGGLTVWLSPWSGSHLDQFAAQVVDNDLGHVMGMAAGGFSNKWWTRETLCFPTTGKPIVTYEWSMGHSLRPNGEILQYNPAEPNEYIPQTRDNYFDYHPQLLKRTFERLETETARRSTP